MAEIALTGLTKKYADGTVAVADLTLTVADGEFLVLVGPSGCGKSTVLRCVAGLEAPSAGAITIGGRRVEHLPPQARDLAMVFQSYALYPHMKVYDNLAFGLKMQGVSREEIKARVEAVAAKLAILPYLNKKPRDLSGGERQRVALGRAIIRQPQAFLMDEPLSNLDAALRVKMRTELLKLQRELGVTVLYVTHDQTEALTMGDRVAVLQGGRLQQVDSPRQLYQRPGNRFVAAFIGSPAMNFITGRLIKGAKGPGLEMAGGVCDLPRDFLAPRPELAAWLGKTVVVGLRPEHLEPASGAGEGAQIQLRGRVEVVETLGAVNQVHLSLPDPLDDGGGEVWCTALIDPEIRPAPGRDLELAVAPERLHFFRPEDGDRL